jgi:hypothetical protein
MAVTTLAGPPAGTNIAGRFDGTGTNAVFSYPASLLVLPSGVIAVSENGNNAVRLVTLPFVLPACDSTWHHVALTYTPTATPFSLVGFLDGAAVLQQAVSVTLPARASASLRIAFNGDLSTNGGSLFAGALDDLRIFARALTSAEVAALSQPRLASYLSAFPNTVSSPASATASATSYAFTCVAGYAGPLASLARRPSDGSWAWLGGVTPSCSICAAGSYSAAGATACTLCPTGITTTGTSTGSLSVASCTTCAPGFYGTVTGSGTVSASGCSPCPSGIFTTGSAAGSLTVAACTICAPGYSGVVSSGGTTSATGCSICAAGSFAAAAAATCSSCLPGSYSSQGAPSCTSCPAGTALPGTGATLPSQCVACAAGSAAPAGSPTCTTCLVSSGAATLPSLPRLLRASVRSHSPNSPPLTALRDSPPGRRAAGRYLRG